MNGAIYDVAKTYLGLEEFPGAKQNPKIIQMFAQTGNGWVHDDETPWCAAFVGAVLAQCGIKGTGKLNARSYLDWGVHVDPADMEQGDVVILQRGNNPNEGHVAFFDSIVPHKGTIRLLGGNQGNKVSLADFPVARVIGVRRAEMPKPQRTNVAQSTTVQASAVQLASGVGGGLAAVGALDGNAQIVALVLCAIVVFTAAWIMRERIKKWVDGIR